MRKRNASMPLHAWIDDIGSKLPDAKIEEVSKRIGKFDLLHIPVEINPRLTTTAGRAWAHKIELNPDLVFEEPPKHQWDTLLHEVAHIIGYKLGGEFAHDYYWRRACRWLGIAPERCHTFASMQRRRR